MNRLPLGVKVYRSKMDWRETRQKASKLAEVREEQ